MAKKSKTDAHYGKVIAKAGKGKAKKSVGPFTAGDTGGNKHAGLLKYAKGQTTLKSI